jgi:RNase P subunit RPR2
MADTKFENKIVIDMMKHWNNGAKSSIFPNEDTLSCPVCGSVHVYITCNSFYGAATPYQECGCNDCGHKERVSYPPKTKEK